MKSSQQSAQDRLNELLEFVLDGSCTDDQREEVAKLIDEHPDLIRGLTGEVFIHSLLQWQGESITGELQRFDLPAEEEIALHYKRKSEVSPAKDTRFRGLGFFSAAAALFLCITALLLVSWPWGVSVEDAVVARIVQHSGVIWSSESTYVGKNHHVFPGRLETRGGEFTLEFASGPIVHVSGPVSMMIESEMLVHLDRGQVTARVPNDLTGFTINTPVINVIDQGTEFGVATRESGHTDVVVFDGKVDLQDSISSQNSPTRLIQGEAARVDRSGTLQRIMQVGRNSKGGWWTVDYPENAVNVIKEVRDNIPPSDGSQYFCYQITYRGLQDDVFAYADRHPHQWNGLSRTGLPAFLQGADYVKTFNDYRYLNDFQMEVILSRPANLYVFFDDRVPPPQWLTEKFVDTGFDIGLDEGPWEGIPHHRNAQGAGLSIDNVFSVWKRECLDLTPITLGLMGKTAQARAMYGIAATPLLEPEQMAWNGLVKKSVAKEEKTEIDPFALIADWKARGMFELVD